MSTGTHKPEAVIIATRDIIRAAKELNNTPRAPEYYSFNKYEIAERFRAVEADTKATHVHVHGESIAKAVEAPKGWTKNQYLEFHEATCRKMIEVTKAKNADYTGGSGDPFANFKQASNFVMVPQITEIGFFTRMTDKFSRIGSFLTKGFLQVKDESVEDTLIDLANYCILFAGYLRSLRTVKQIDHATEWGGPINGDG